MLIRSSRHESRDPKLVHEDVFKVARRESTKKNAPLGYKDHNTARNPLTINDMFSSSKMLSTIPNGNTSLRWLSESGCKLSSLGTKSHNRIQNRDQSTQSEFNITNFKLAHVDHLQSDSTLRVVPALGYTENGTFLHEGNSPAGICYQQGRDGLRVGDVRYLNDGTLVLVVALLVVDKFTGDNESKFAKLLPFSVLVVVGDLSDLSHVQGPFEEDKNTCFLVAHTSIMPLMTEANFDQLIASQLFTVTKELHAKFIPSALTLLTNGEKNDMNMFECVSHENVLLSPASRQAFGKPKGKPSSEILALRKAEGELSPSPQKKVKTTVTTNPKNGKG
jgi:hypothetical protein